MAQFEEGTTLDRFLLETLREHPEASGQFVTLLKQAALHRRRMAFCHALKKGDQVFLPRWRRLCTVHKVDRVREQVSVDYGNVKMDVPFEDVSWLQPLGG